jgi:predicted MPP superfamily phosphohydrolase
MAAKRALARRIRRVEHEVELPNLGKAHRGLRVAHLTDVHCGRVTPAHVIRRAVELVNEARPAVVVMTGDYVCWHKREADLIPEQLGGIEAPVYATLGNHDYMASGSHVADAMRDCGYNVLFNEHATLRFGDEDLHLVGIDDPVTRRDDIERAFAEVPDEGTRVVLCHCPEKLGEVAEYGESLVVSGHTHGGQINVRGVTNRIYKRVGRQYFQAGFYRESEALMYLSPGVGFSGVRIRAGAGTHAEVTLFELRQSSQESDLLDQSSDCPTGDLKAG